MNAREYMIVDLERKGDKRMFITEQVSSIQRNSLSSGAYIHQKAQLKAESRRSTQLLLMTKLKEEKNAKEVAKEVVRLLLPFKGKMLKNIITDHGREFAKHQERTKKLGVVVYFADAYASWQKGSIENTNKLIRQYIPKGVSFEKYTDKRVMSIQKKINSRPRKTLEYNTPIKAFYQLIP